jgi:hypothetical protein
MIKKIFSAVILFWIFSISNTYAQQFNSGIRLGLNANQINGDRMAGFNHIGFVGGLFTDYQFNNKWDAGFEMLFSQKGSHANHTAYERDSGLWYKMTLNYVEVPFMAGYYISPKIKVMAGLGFGYLISATQRDSMGSKWKATTAFKKIDFNATVGVEYFLTPKWGLFLRYTNSLLPMGSKDNAAVFFGHGIGGLTNLTASFGIYYNFTEPKGTKRS